MRALLLLLLLLGVLLPLVHADDCPIKYANDWKLLFGELQNTACSSQQTGKSCERSGYWWEQCRFPTWSWDFGVCSDQQRAETVKIAEKLQNGAPMKLTPCELYFYLRGRTLWLIGDSHMKQLFKSIQCFMIDFWDQRECRASHEDWLNQQLDALPMKSGESKCINLMGEGRVCLVGAVLGTALLENSQVANNGVLNLLRDRLAKPSDIMVINFGVWWVAGPAGQWAGTTKEGDWGMEQYRLALTRLGEDYQRNRHKWPHVFFRETPMSHEKDMQKNLCLPAPQGWGLDYGSGRLYIQANARSAGAQALVAGGGLNAPAREILGKYQVPMIGGFDYSVPLYGSHPGTRGTSALDCLHFCSFGLPELVLYDMTRTFQAGAGGVKRRDWVDPNKRLSCKQTGGGYRRLQAAAP